MQSDQMTRKEFQNLKKSFKDPKFHSLLGDYMLEISNPNNVEEQNEYMRQLLREKQLPEGTQLLEPKMAYVLSSKIGSKGDRKFSQGLFINICGHDQIERAEMASQKDGRNKWKVPYRMGKLRLSQMGEKGQLSKVSENQENSKENLNNLNIEKKELNQKEKKAEIVSVIDVVFHSEAVLMSGVFAPFKKMVCDIALDGVRKLLEKKDQILDKDYQVKDGDPNEKLGLIMIGSNTKKNEEPTNLKDKPDLYYEMMEKQKNAKKNEDEENQKIQTLENNVIVEETKKSIVKK